MDYSQPGSSVPGILQARKLQWAPFPTSGDLTDPGIKPMSLALPALAGRYFTTVPAGKPQITHKTSLGLGCNMWDLAA